MLKPDTGDDGGASAVEFAIIAPLLFLLLFGFMQFGIWFFQWQSLQASAREGARIGSLQNTDVGTIIERAEANLSLISDGDVEPSAVELCEPTLAVPYCISVTSIAVSGTTTHASTTDQPCASSATDRVRVRVAYFADAILPLMPLTEFVMGGEGEFACE